MMLNFLPPSPMFKCILLEKGIVMISKKLMVFCTFYAVIAASCGKDEEESLGTLKLSMTTTGQPSSSLKLASANDFLNSSIASGAPDSMTLYIKRISLKETDEGAPFPIFYEESGKPIKVSAGKIDISQLFTLYECIGSAGVPVEGVGECPCGLDEDDKPVASNSDGTCPEGEGTNAVAIADAQEGSFKYLEMELLMRGTIKGCVTGNFQGGDQSNSAATQGEHTYCTQESLHTFQDSQGAASASDFENVSAEDMKFQISLGNELISDETATTTLNIPLTEEITISGDSSPTMTMVIDTNRMLRFYNKNFEQSINPGVPKDRAFFFNTVFDYSTFAFVGSPGDIRGFQWWTEACSGTVTNDRLCTSGSNVQTVAGWVTVVKGSDDKPLVVGFMPDDDNSWTIIKGSNKSASGLDPDAFTSSGSAYDIGFQLGTDGSGVIYGLELDNDLGTIQESTFEGLQDSYGKIYLDRKL